MTPRRLPQTFALALALAGCGDVVAQPIGAGASGADASTADSPVTADGPLPDLGPATDASFCSGTGPIPLPGSDGGTGQCTGDLAHLFRFAACACTSFAVSGTLTTSSFDSTSDAGPISTNAASIAANAAVATNAQTTVGGSVWAGGQGVAQGSPAVTLEGTGTVAGDVQSGGDVQVGGIYQVTGNVFANGDVSLVDGGSLQVGGTVHVPAGDTASGVTAGGGVVSGPVQVAPPCDCSSPIDIASIVAGSQDDNDDANLNPALAVTAFDQASPMVDLPCGQYWVDGMQSTGTVTLNVLGRVVLYVGGDVSVQALTINLPTTNAELDLFVAGSITILGSTAIGTLDAPARVRIYMSGSTLGLSADAHVGANVYAPNAVVQLASDFQMWGAIFAQDLQFSGNFSIAYDTSVLQQPGCPVSPGSPCKTCDDCSGGLLACKSGACANCTTSADCCAPLGCVNGECVLQEQ
jgi:hypothetical protein